MVFKTMYHDYKKIYPIGLIFLIMFIMIFHIKQYVETVAVFYSLLFSWNSLYVLLFIWNYIYQIILKSEIKDRIENNY